MSDGVIILATLDVKSEYVEGMVAIIPEMIKDTAKRPGFRDIRVVRDGNKISLIEEWDSEADYHAYIAWRTERGEIGDMHDKINGVKSSVWRTLVARA
jgi:quinol monooxygenase YgiN